MADNSELIRQRRIEGLIRVGYDPAEVRAMDDKQLNVEEMRAIRKFGFDEFYAIDKSTVSNVGKEPDWWNNYLSYNERMAQLRGEKSTDLKGVDPEDAAALSAMYSQLAKTPDNEFLKEKIQDIVSENNYTETQLAPLKAWRAPESEEAAAMQMRDMSKVTLSELQQPSTGTTTGTGGADTLLNLGTTRDVSTATQQAGSLPTATGAAGGAAIGATVAGPVGAVVGAIGGGLLGSFLDGSSSIDEAGDAEQARIVQAIDLINQNIAATGGARDAATEEYINTVRDTLNGVKTEILNGNADAAEKLRVGLTEKLALLDTSYNLSSNTLQNAYNIIEGNLLEGRDTARADITAGRDNALTSLRTSLTNSLDALSQGTDQASRSIQESLQRTRQTYAPYIAAGQKSIARAEQLTNDPQAKLDYVQNNPFFAAMQETARDQLFANQAAKGRLGTGETLNELDKRTLLMGEQLVGQNIGQNLQIGQQGLQAGSLQTGADTSLTSLLSQLYQNSGIAGANLNQAYGQNAANIQTRAGESLGDVSTGTAQNLSQVGTNLTNMLNNNIGNLTGLGFQATNFAADNLYNLVRDQTQQHAQLTGQQGMLGADARLARSDANIAGMNAGTGSIASLLMALGQSESAEAIGEQAAQRQGFNDLISLGSLAVGAFGAGGPLASLIGGGSTALNTVGPLSGGYAGATGGTNPYYYNPTPVGGNIWNPPNLLSPYGN